MKLSLHQEGGYLIQGYGPGEVRIAGRVFRRSLILTPERILEGWPPAAFEELVGEHLIPVAEAAPDIALLGVGERQRFPAPALLRPLYERRIGVEVMTTAAACRTYNVLVAEGRRVVAALIINAAPD